MDLASGRKRNSRVSLPWTVVDSGVSCEMNGVCARSIDPQIRQVIRVPGSLEYQGRAGCVPKMGESKKIPVFKSLEEQPSSAVPLCGFAPAVSAGMAHG